MKPEEPITLTPTIIFFVGCAFADWLSHRLGITHSQICISVGHDPRLSSPLVASSLVTGLASRGVRVTEFGLATTPAMFMSCILPERKYDGAVMITASHLPVNRNGAKFFQSSGGLGKQDIKLILQKAADLADEAGIASWTDLSDSSRVIQAALKIPSSHIDQKNFMETYAAHLRQIVRDNISNPHTPKTPLAGLKVVVNAGNGAGGFFATDVLAPLGADTSASVNLVPDGSFPSHVPNPEDKTAVAVTRQAVLTSNSDLGIMLDTDVDRSGIVDRNGKAINRNRYIALMAAVALRENPGETIVTDSCTSNGLATFIKSLGGIHFRYKKGYKNIIDKGIELQQAGIPCPLMMETSGHGAMRENYYLDDGAYMALKIVIEAVRRRLEGNGDVAELLDGLKEPVEAMEIRVKVKASDVAKEAARITADFKAWVDEGAGGASNWRLEDENYEGWRVRIDEGNSKEGWLLLRPSLHDPDIVLNVEGETEGSMRQTLTHLLEFFKIHPDYEVCTGLVEDYVYNPALA